MTLLEYMNQHADEEIAVHDTEYEMESYFYGGEPHDEWDKAMQKIAGLLEIREEETEAPNAFYVKGVTVNLSEMIEKNLSQEKAEDLFKRPDIDSIMQDMMNILSGHVPEQWFVDFADAFESGSGKENREQQEISL